MVTKKDKANKNEKQTEFVRKYIQSIGVMMLLSTMEKLHMQDKSVKKYMDLFSCAMGILDNKDIFASTLNIVPVVSECTDWLCSIIKEYNQEDKQNGIRPMD